MLWVGNAMPDLVAERILAAWGVPQEAWEGLLANAGADQVHEVKAALQILMPLGTANAWMNRPSDMAPFGGEPPMRILLEPGGLVWIRSILLKHLGDSYGSNALDTVSER